MAKERKLEGLIFGVSGDVRVPVQKLSPWVPDLSFESVYQFEPWLLGVRLAPLFVIEGAWVTPGFRLKSEGGYLSEVYLALGYLSKWDGAGWDIGLQIEGDLDPDHPKGWRPFFRSGADLHFLESGLSLGLLLGFGFRV